MFEVNHFDRSIVSEIDKSSGERCLYPKRVYRTELFLQGQWRSHLKSVIWWNRIIVDFEHKWFASGMNIFDFKIQLEISVSIRIKIQSLEIFVHAKWLLVACVQINLVQSWLRKLIFVLQRVPAHFGEDIIVPTFKAVSFVKVCPSFALENNIWKFDKDQF